MRFISRNSKILSISHSDLDGVVCQIVLGNIYQNIKYVNIGFDKIDDYLEALNFNNYDYVFLTDIHPKDSSLLYKSHKIILIDHHCSNDDVNDPRNQLFVVDGVCASLLTKRFVEKMYSIRLTNLDNLVYLTNDYDLWIHKNPKSKLLNELMFAKYRAWAFRKKYMDGHTRFDKEEIEWLRKRMNEFKEEWNKLEVFDIDEIDGCVVRIYNYKNDIAHKLLDEEGYKFVIVKDPVTPRVSVRHNIEGLNMGRMLSDLGYGGGHEFAAGFSTDGDLDFTDKVNIIVENVKEHLNSVGV